MQSSAESRPPRGDARKSAAEPGFSPKQRDELDALMVESTYADAARRANVAESTLRRWLRDDEAFKAAYRRASDGFLQEAAFQAKFALRTSLATLEQVCVSSASDVARVSAARSIIDGALRLTEVADVLARLEALEHEGR